MTSLLPRPALYTDMAWRVQGRCHDSSPGLFFSVAMVDIESAKQICRECPVARQCLEHALTNEAGEYGIWGGTDEGERRTLRRRRAGA